MSKTYLSSDSRRRETAAERKARRDASRDIMREYGIPFGTVKIDPDDSREYDAAMWNVDSDREHYSNVQSFDSNAIAGITFDLSFLTDD